MKRILTTLKEKWPEYLLEILVLIIGIYGAFMLDNWNEKRNEGVQEQRILHQLKIEYQENLKQLDEKIEMRNYIIAHSIKILEMIDNPEKYSTDSLLSYIRSINVKPTFDPVSNDIIISGNIRLITNPRLKQLLQHWSSDVIQVQEEERRWDKISTEQMGPLINRLGIRRFIAAKTDINSEVNRKLMSLILIDSTKSNFIESVPKSNAAFDALPLLQNKEFDGIVTSAFQLNRIANAQSFILRDKIIEILSLIETSMKD